MVNAIAVLNLIALVVGAALIGDIFGWQVATGVGLIGWASMPIVK